jgi:hypothetical protein
MSQGTFLTAEWNHLLMLNYAVEPSLLKEFLPSGTLIDEFEGQTYISLVGFVFNRTRIAGLAVPFHRSFEEVNLRFYVKRHSRRGVAFIRELVPKRAIAAVARYAYGEKYSCVPMSHRVNSGTQNGSIEAEYTWGSQANRCSMHMRTAEESFLPPDGSLGQFITEHYWGYSAQSNGGCLEYEVQHPRWQIRAAAVAEFSGDSAPFYGAAFANVLLRPPDSAFLADGSPVTVSRGNRID